MHRYNPPARCDVLRPSAPRVVSNSPALQPTNPPTLQPTNPRALQPTNPRALQPTNPRTLQPTNPPTLQPTNHPSRRTLFLFALAALLTNSAAAQISSTTAGGNWWEAATWIGGVVPDADDDVVVQGPVVVRTGDVCRNLTITSAGSIGDLQGGAFSDQLRVEGDVNNSGIIEAVNPPNSLLSIRVFGDVVNAGTWNPSTTHLDGAEAHLISTVGDATLDGYWANDAPSAELQLASDLNLGVVDFRLQGGRLLGAGFTINADSVSQLRSGTVVGPVTLAGHHSIQSGLILQGDVTNDGVIEAFSGGSFVDNLSITGGGTFRNTGTIRNDGAELAIAINADVVNEGAWVTRHTTFTGAENHLMQRNGGSLGGTWFASDSTTVVADSILTFSDAIVQMRPGLLDMNGFALTLVDGSLVDQSDLAVDSIAFHSDARLWRSTIFGDVTLTGKALIGWPVVVEGNLTVVDSLIDTDGNIFLEGVDVRGSIFNTGVVQGNIRALVTGDIVNTGTFAASSVTLTGAGPRTLIGLADTPASIAAAGSNVAFTGVSKLPRLSINNDAFVRTTGQGAIVIPEGGLRGTTANFENFGRVVVSVPALPSDAVSAYDLFLRMPATADFDTLFVETWGNQSPPTYGSAVRNWWRLTPGTATATRLPQLELFYDEDQIADNVEDDLEVYHSADSGATWQRVSVPDNLTRDPANNKVTVTDVPAHGDYLVSSIVDPVSVAPNVIVTFTGRDAIRIGAPTRYTFTYTNAGAAPTGDLTAVLSLGALGHISKIFLETDDPLVEIELVPEDFLLDESAADSMAILFVSGMDPGETRTLSFEAWSDPPTPSPGKSAELERIDLVTPTLAIIVAVATAEILREVVDFKSTQMYKFCQIVRDDYETYGGSDFELAWARARAEALRFQGRETKYQSAKRLFDSLRAFLNGTVGALAAGRVVLNLAKCVGELGGYTIEYVRTNNPLTTTIDRICSAGDDLALQRIAGASGSSSWTAGRAANTCPVHAIYECERELTPVTSFDPNEKHGPAGVDIDGFVSSAGRMDYTIFFENLESAGAAAYRITIDDTLAAVFDPETVQVGPSSHPGFTFTRNGSVLHWEVEGIELPPNVIPPEGEGFVSFGVDPLPDLPSGTALTNRASIVFDLNEPILTNEHRNTLDFDAPTTTMTPIDGPVLSDSTTIEWSSDDSGGSGARDAAVFVSRDMGPFEFVGTSAHGRMTVATVQSGTYRFYALATDRVGNAESIRPALSSVEVTHLAVGADGELKFELAPAYPNPFGEATWLEYSLPRSGEASVVVYDVLGRRVSILADGEHSAGPHQVRWQPSGMASGLYFIRLTQGSEQSVVPVVRYRL